MANNIAVSIIVPIYNVESYLKECLDSIIRQTLENIEIICINDGSTDDSLGVLYLYQEKDARIKIISRENRGVGITRNEGISVARGEYVMFMDPDDFYPSNDVLEVLYDTVVLQRAFIAGGSFSSLRPNGEIQTKFNEQNKGYTFIESGLVSYIDYQFEYGFQRFIYNRNFLLKNQIFFPNYRRFQDPPFLVAALSAAGSFFALSKVVYRYRASYKPVGWNEEKVVDYLKGIAECLTLSLRHGYRKLHSSIINRFINIVKSDIGGFVLDSKQVARQLLTTLKYFDNSFQNEKYDHILRILSVVYADFLDNVPFTIPAIFNAIRCYYHEKGMYNYISEEHHTLLGETCTCYLRTYYTEQTFVIAYNALKSSLEHYLSLSTDGSLKDILLLNSADYIRKYSITFSIPRVSIVVPVYNMSRYLRECMDSLLLQTLKEIEIVCVNDGSTDNSLDILKEYANIDGRIVIIDKPNAGYGVAMNTGIRAATGLYVGEVDPDDYVLSNMYKCMYDKITELGVDVLKADRRAFRDVRGVRQYDNISTASTPDMYNKVLNVWSNPEIYMGFPGVNASLHNREFLIQNDIYFSETPGVAYQDNIFWLKEVLNAKKVFLWDEAFYMLRRDNPNSSVHNKQQVYAVRDVYKDSLAYLSTREKEFEMIKGHFFKRIYQHYRFTLKRIAPEHKRDFVKVFSSDFSELYEARKLDQSLFFHDEWEDLMQLIQDPEKFYFRKVFKYIAVSIVIPVYNTESYIRKCIESLLSQTLNDIELICVNDGSTDKSLDILHEYAFIDPRIRVISQENKGAAIARNHGLTYASGEYVVFLDSDDFYDASMLFLMYEKIKKEKADVCLCSARFVDENTKTTYFRSLFNKELMPKKSFFKWKDIKGSPFNTYWDAPWNKLYRREYLVSNNILFQDIRNHNDNYFVHLSMINANRITLLDKTLLTHRVNVKGSLQNTKGKDCLCFFEAHMAIKQICPPDNIDHFLFWTMHVCIDQLEKLDLLAAQKLHTFLTEEGFDRIGITTAPKEIFDATYYEKYKVISSLSADGFFNYKLDLIQQRNIKLESDVNMYKEKLKKATNSAAPDTQNVKRVEWLREELKKAKAETEKERASVAFLKNQIEETYRSKTYRLGNAITALPRLLVKKAKIGV